MYLFHYNHFAVPGRPHRGAPARPLKFNGFTLTVGVPAAARRAKLAGAAIAMIGLGSLGGCALRDAYEKCGFTGCPDDRRISRDVRILLDQHPALEAPNLIAVRTLDHVVYLNGVVDTDLERQLAESVAAEAQGVARVVNSIGLNNAR
ncbi:MAG TPA: BON domain-containing protein [Steroidobacteraceae bacterium]|nr:BON domain-containing protein [Steroidobacteraceae bacterium]